MRTCGLIFAVLFLLCVVLALWLAQPEPAAGHGVAHPDLASMDQGGDPQRHAGRLWLGWLFGSLQIVLFVACLRLGVKPGQTSSWLFVLAGGVYVAAFSLLMIAYANGTAGSRFVLGYPLPTALLVYGLWPVAFLFVVLYVFKYRSWIYSPEDARRFAALKAEGAREAPHG